jgi:hypothetical protein
MVSILIYFWVQREVKRQTQNQNTIFLIKISVLEYSKSIYTGFLLSYLWIVLFHVRLQYKQVIFMWFVQNKLYLFNLMYHAVHIISFVTVIQESLKIMAW